MTISTFKYDPDALRAKIRLNEERVEDHFAPAVARVMIELNMQLVDLMELVHERQSGVRGVVTPVFLNLKMCGKKTCNVCPHPTWRQWHRRTRGDGSLFGASTDIRFPQKSVPALTDKVLRGYFAYAETLIAQRDAIVKLNSKIDKHSHYLRDFMRGRPGA